jgi:threonylcarbamoyladenosine tRNA methylthiotransferase MtaB
MLEMVPKRIKAERSLQLAEIESELREQYFQSLLGRRLTVLVEGSSERGANWVTGTSCRYAPVEFPGESTAESSLVEIRAERLAADRIVGTAIGSSNDVVNDATVDVG